MKNCLPAVVLIVLVGLSGCESRATEVPPASSAAAATITVNDDFSAGNEVWKGFEGRWAFIDNTLRQISRYDDFPLILRVDQNYRDVDVSVDFKPLAGQIDASGGIVFRAQDRDNYYIVRANALENNFRLYTFKNGQRRQIASARVSAPRLGQYHRIRVVARGDHIQAYLDGALYLDIRDATYSRGSIGLWTKADSVTEFDNLQISGTPAN